MINTSLVCRSCLREGGLMKKLFAIDGKLEEYQLDVMLMSSTQVQVSQDDGLPGQICLNCVERLVDAFAFKNMCQLSYSRLKQEMVKAVENGTVEQNMKYEVLSKNHSGIIDFKTMLNSEVTTIKEEMTDTEASKEDSKNRIDNEKCTQTTGNDSIELFNCFKCQKKFSSHIGLATHLSKHGMADALSCSDCSDVFFNSKDLQEHRLIAHPKNKDSAIINFQCTVCNKTFTERDLFDRHKRSHNKRKNFTCSKCDVVFNGIVAYETHSCNNRTNDVPNHNEKTNSSMKSASQCPDLLVEVPKDEMILCEEIIVEPFRDDDIDVAIKEEPLDDILEEAERESEIISGDVSDNYLDIAELSFKDFVNDPEFIPGQVIKKVSTSKKLIDQINKINLPKKVICNFKCPICPKVFSSSSFLSEHEAKEHLKSSYTCSICTKTYKNRQLFQKHEMAHDLGKYECGTCKKVFDRPFLLNQHMWVHSTHKPFRCNMCDKGFLKEQHLERHKQALHSGKEKNPKIAFCEICCRGFTTLKYLETHMRMHTGDKTFTCEVCDKSFNSKWHLKEHSRWHSTEKPFLCSECGQRFIRNDYLVIHMRRHNGEKPYKCKFCDKGFPRATDLTVHERYHTGEKTHLCTVCGKGFQRQYNLTVHLRVHTGEKPYICSYCGKKFAQGNDLKSHVRRHTGERFNCDVCGEGFIQGYHLTQHKKSVHGIESVSHIKRVEKHPLATEKNKSELIINSQVSKENTRIGNGQSGENLDSENETGL